MSGQFLHQSDESIPEPQTSSWASKSYPWKPGVWAQLPWVGLGALLGTLLFTGAAVGVLILSNGSPIERWQVIHIDVQPQVWVSIFSTVANAWLGYALVEGLTIIFWRKAGRGTMLRTLHDTYESQSVISAAATLLHGSLSPVAIACILVTASNLRGPLFQRASTVNDRAIQSLSGQLELQVAQFLPIGYFQRVSQYQTNLLTPEFKQLINNSTTSASYTLAHTRCGGGVGFGVTCESSSYDFSVDEADMAAKAAAIGCSSFFGYNNDTSDTNVTFCKELEKPENYQTAQFGKVKVFAVGFENGGPAAGSPDKCFRPVRNADDALRDDCISSGINITTAFKNTPTCKGRAQARRCTLRQGVVEYAVMIKNDTISLRNPHWQNDTFLQDTPVNLLDMANYWWEVFPQLYPPIQVNLEHGPRSNSLVFGLYGDCLSSYRESNTSCSVAGFQTQPIVLKDLSIRYINQADPNLSECNYTWSDPMQDLLDGMRDFAFRASLDVATFTNRSLLFADRNDTDIPSLTSNWTQRVTYTGTEYRTVYRTDWKYVIAAVIVSLSGTFAVMPLYHGWWELGRSVSLNPVEMAKAFGAPLLKNVNSNADRSHIVKQVGLEKVRYGVVEEILHSDDSDFQSWRLLVDVDEDGHVKKPKPGVMLS